MSDPIQTTDRDREEAKAIVEDKCTGDGAYPEGLIDAITQAIATARRAEREELLQERQKMVNLLLEEAIYHGNCGPEDAPNHGVCMKYPGGSAINFEKCACPDCRICLKHQQWKAWLSCLLHTAAGLNANVEGSEAALSSRNKTT